MAQPHQPEPRKRTVEKTEHKPVPFEEAIRRLLASPPRPKKSAKPRQQPR